MVPRRSIFVWGTLPGWLVSLVVYCILSAGIARADETIYAEALGSGWENWSWDCALNFSDGSPVHGGAASLAVTHQAAWAGCFLHRTSTLDPATVTHLRFWLHGGAGGQQIRVALLDAAGNPGTQTYLIANPAANAWTQYNLPLSTFGTLDAIGGVWWMNDTGGAQGTFNLDDVVLVSGANPQPTPTPVPPVALTVNAGQVLRPIDPAIYGINFGDETWCAEVGIPLRRWGGNSVTRYNWQNDTSNHASDWYFENIPEDNDNPGALPNGSASDKFVAATKAMGAQSIVTVPLIGWTPKAREWAWGFSVAKYGAQQSVDPWRTDAGNGLHANGSALTGNDPRDTSVAIGPPFVAQWIAHLQGRFGAAESGGVRYYALDNEPMLWNSTHRDVHPDPVSYDEMLSRTLAYAAAIRTADPQSKILGPVLWGWTAYFYSAADAASAGDWWNHPPDRQAHGNQPFVEWYLDQLHTHQQTHGVRLLDYLDLHYYPQADGVTLTTAGNAATRALRLRSTRSLWDPAYVDESWIGEAVQLLPRMRAWVDAHYPGTKLALTEYNWGGLEHINGALAQADVLGIFGREGLDLATLWSPPEPGQPGAFAFRMFLDYDGAGGKFGDQAVAAGSGDQSKLAVYAARRGAAGDLTILLVNKAGAATTGTLQLANWPAGAPPAQVWRYSAANLTAIVRQADLPLGTAANPTLPVPCPADSLTLLVLPATARNDAHGWQSYE